MTIEQPNPVYRKSLVVFIDVLGFRELVRKDAAGHRVAAVFRDLRSFGREDLSDQARYRDATFLHFSDSVVRILPIVDDDPYLDVAATLRKELEDLTHIQAELVLRDVWIRGGIAVGDVFADETGAFGPAFNEAYELESQLALYPRIVLHPALVATCGELRDGRQAIWAKDGLPLARCGSDGLHFVDYFGNFPREMYSERSLQVETSEQRELAVGYATDHKERIERELAGHALLSRTRAKYVWLARYRNEVTLELLGDEGKSHLVGY